MPSGKQDEELESSQKCPKMLILGIYINELFAIDTSVWIVQIISVIVSIDQTVPGRNLSINILIYLMTNYAA